MKQTSPNTDLDYYIIPRVKKPHLVTKTISSIGRQNRKVGKLDNPGLDANSFAFITSHTILFPMHSALLQTKITNQRFCYCPTRAFTFKEILPPDFETYFCGGRSGVMSIVLKLFRLGLQNYQASIRPNDGAKIEIFQCGNKAKRTPCLNIALCNWCDCEWVKLIFYNLLKFF